MAFIKEITENIEEGLSAKEKVTVIGFKSAYFECVLSICKYSPCEVELCLKNKRVKVCGEELYIKKFCGGDALICGKIKSIAVE